ncbi:alpha/beta fold hydrolase [Candidatus Bathyarchaeota archaeon]|nr:alpha/beta fold hydrolase [Candidatus Bathyarchaeota archaeon]
MYGAYRVNNSNGELSVTNIVIPGENRITGVLYTPKEAREDAPCILLAHGIVNSKESLSGVALELAKHEYLALSIDLLGHGGSSGAISESDPSLGVIRASDYLLTYSNNSQIGLIGHSMGAGAVYYAASHGVPEIGVVLIGGGIGSNSYDTSKEFVVPQPRNPLVVIGRYDVLFPWERIEESLETTFPVHTPELNELKGDPHGASMTLLLMPCTSHLFEPVSPAVVASTVNWFNTINRVSVRKTLSYLQREGLFLFAFIFFIAALVLASTLGAQPIDVTGFDRTSGVIYGLVGFIVFIPSMLLGNIMSFPPQIFGSSISWWLLIWGLIVLGFSRYWKKSEFYRIESKDVFYAFGLFFLSYLFVFGLEYLFGFSFRLIVPIMRVPTTRRWVAFVFSLPFMLVHFYSEATWFGDKASCFLGFAVSKFGLFSGVLLIQYGGFFLLDTVLVSGFYGFILEFLVAIVPVMLISGLITSWCMRNGRSGVSIVLNSLLFSWIAAGLFPY